MTRRLRALGLLLAVVGLVFVAVGGYAYMQQQDGARSLAAFSKAQNVKLTYNDQGQLVSAGTTEEANAIKSLLANDWGWKIVDSDLNPKDPIINTPTEYMYQMAMVAYHTLNSTQTVVLDKDVTYNGKLYAAGTYKFNVDGRYWADFDRANPIEGPARAQAWTGTAHALIAELGVGAATASALELGLGLVAIFVGFGGTMLLVGIGLVWVSRGTVEVPVPSPVATRIPQAGLTPQGV